MPDDIVSRYAAASRISELWPDMGRIRVIEVHNHPNGSVDVLVQARSMPNRPAGKPFWLTLTAADFGGEPS